MKKLAFIFVFISNISFSQIIKINVSEVVYSYNIDTIEYSLTELLNKQDLPKTKRIVNSSYKLDLTYNQFKYYTNDVLEFEGDIVFSNVGNFYNVDFIINGYNIGMLINLDVYNEQVTWFSLIGVAQEISKFTQFEIVKGF
jgi:hypothetical protein